jgi:2'-5' RNA ligase
MSTLWLSPSGALEGRLRSLIERYATELGTPSFAPHVTLLNGWAGDAEPDRLAELLSGLTPLDLAVRDATSSADYFRCVVLELELAGPLRVARERARALAGVSGEDDYHPHLSIVYGDLPSSNRERVRAELTRSLPTSIRVDRLDVVSTVGPVEQWSVVKRFEF